MNLMGAMPSERLRELITDFAIAWFFIPNYTNFDARDILDLPPKYLKRIEAFISSHNKEELIKIKPKDFIEQSTGESYDKIVKLINVAKKVQSIEQDFN